MIEKKVLSAMDMTDISKIYFVFSYPEEDLYVRICPEQLEDNRALIENYTLHDGIKDGLVTFVDSSHPDFEGYKTFDFKERDSDEYSDFYINVWKTSKNHIKYLNKLLNNGVKK